MLILNCTKAAAEFFSTTKKGIKISPFEPAPTQTVGELTAESYGTHEWQLLIHAIKIKGKNVLIAMDCQTRFSITLSELKKGDVNGFLNNLEHHLTVHVHEMMAAIDADSQAIQASLERYFQQHDSRAFYLRGDRSIQAHINDVAWHFRNFVENQGAVPSGVDLIGYDVFVNQLLRKRKAEKDYFYPQREFLHGWLRHYGAYNTAQADACIESLAARERAEFNEKHPTLSDAAADYSVEHLASSLRSNADTSAVSNVISLDDYRKKNCI